MTGFWWIVLIVVAAIVAAPFVLERLRPEPNVKAATKGKEGHKFADLPSGTTHYRWIGPARGPVAVLIHGIATPSGIWEDVAAGLAATSFRVLVYDLYGRGLSDAPAGQQNAGFFVRQLEELLDHLGLQEDLTVAGFSLGGAIATAFADKHPERMTRLVLLAPAGIIVNEAPLDRFMRQMPLIGDWLHGVVGPARARASAAGGTGPIADAKRRQAGQRGFVPSILSARRGVLGRTQMAEHRRIGAEDIPVLAVWGAQDEDTPLRGIGTLAQWNRNARQEEIEGADHGLLMSHPDEVVAALRRLIRE